MATNHGGDPLASILGSMGSHCVQKMGQKHKKLPSPKICIFDYPAVIYFSRKMEVTVMAPNHGGDPIGSILGPMGSHWVKKMGQNRKKITMPQNAFFRLPRGHRFFAKNGNYGYGVKSRWGSRGVYLGANGVPLGPKNGSKPYKITMPQNSNFRLHRDHRFFPKNGSYGYGTKSRWGLPRVHLGPNGVPLGPKMGQNHKKLPCPKIRIFDYPAVVDFLQQMEVTVMATNHGGEHVGSIFGPMGSHWVKKMGTKRYKLPCPKIRIFDYPAIIDFS